MAHKHHIIPRHKGGTDHPSNLVEVTVEEHAEIHRKLWEAEGNEYDRVAWLALSRQIGKEEAVRMASSIAHKGKKVGLGYRHTPEQKRRNSEAKKGSNHPMWGKKQTPESNQKRKETWKKKMESGYKRKRVHTDEWRKNHSERMSGENHPNYKHGKYVRVSKSK